jgi:hypothetical protein
MMTVCRFRPKTTAALFARFGSCRYRHAKLAPLVATAHPIALPIYVAVLCYFDPFDDVDHRAVG